MGQTGTGNLKRNVISVGIGELSFEPGGSNGLSERLGKTIIICVFLDSNQKMKSCVVLGDEQEKIGDAIKTAHLK